MKSPLFLVVLVVSLAEVLRPSNAQPPCPTDTFSVPPMPDFSLSMVVPKWWYIQEMFFRRSEEIVQPRGSCMQQHTELYWEDQTIMMREDYTNLTSGEYNRKSLWIQSWYPQTPAVLSLVSSWYPGNVFDSQATYVFSDYETYGVVHYCSHEGSATHIPGEHIVVMTGSTSPSETLLGEMKQMVSSLGFPTEHSVKVSSENCTYCWNIDDCPYYDTDELEQGKTEETDF